MIAIAAGLALYIGSFALIAYADASGSVRGYQCALMSLVLPWAMYDGDMIRVRLGFRAVVAVAGFINPVFLAATAVGAARDRHPRAWTFLRRLVCAMIPACWLIFWWLGAYPREGHVAWVVGMLLVLYGRRRH